MIQETVRYPAAGGVEMQSQFVAPDHKPGRPGVIIFPGAAGISAHYVELARKFAALGYAAMASDMYGGGHEIPKTDVQENERVLKMWDANPALILQRAQASLDAMRARKEVDPARVGAVGYCAGGGWSLGLARAATGLRAAVGVHTGLRRLVDDGPPKPITARVLVMNGSADPTIPLGDRAIFEKEMQDAKADWQLHLFGGQVHSFTLPDAADFGRPLTFSRYDPLTDARHWENMKSFFAEALGPV